VAQTEWTAPEVERIDPPLVSDERTSLEAWLDYHRATLLHKCAGLTAAQLVTRAVAPSSLTLLGLVRHLAEVERAWFRRRLGDRAEIPQIYCTEAHPDGDFDLVDAEQAEADIVAYVAECELARAVAVGHALQDTFIGRSGDRIDLRWVYVHMIEEYARHNGHADLIREQIDGATGE
jgi:hypothetical protein